MASFDIVNLFTNIPLKETVEICINKLYTDTDKVHNLQKEDLRKLLLTAAKENHFLFNDQYYDQVDGVSMGSPLGPVLANIFMCHFETNAINNYLGVLPSAYRHYVDDCFLIFNSTKSCNCFFSYLNKIHPNIKFTQEVEENNSLPFPDVLLIRNQEGLIDTTLYRKPTFYGLYTKWTSFISKQVKINLISCLLNRAWNICSTTDLFHKEVECIKQLLFANGYPANFIRHHVNKFISE